MSEKVGNVIPPPLRFELGSEQGAGELRRGLLLATADDDGAPRIAVLSYAEVSALDERRMAITVNAGTRTHHNLERGSSAALWCVLDGAAYSLRGTVRKNANAALERKNANLELERKNANVELERNSSDRATFELTIGEVLRDFYASAPMMSGPMYRKPV
jgi:hypothetical protein